MNNTTIKKRSFSASNDDTLRVTHIVFAPSGVFGRLRGCRVKNGCIKFLCTYGDVILDHRAQRWIPYAGRKDYPITSSDYEILTNAARRNGVLIFQNKRPEEKAND